MTWPDTLRWSALAALALWLYLVIVRKLDMTDEQSSVLEDAALMLFVAFVVGALVARCVQG